MSEEQVKRDIAQFKEKVVMMSEQVRASLIKAADQFEENVKRLGKLEEKISRIQENVDKLDEGTKMLIMLESEELAIDLGLTIRTEHDD